MQEHRLRQTGVNLGLPLFKWGHWVLTHRIIVRNVTCSLWQQVSLKEVWLKGGQDDEGKNQNGEKQPCWLSSVLLFCPHVTPEGRCYSCPPLATGPLGQVCLASDRTKIKTSLSSGKVPALHRDTTSHGVAANALNLATVTSLLWRGPETPHHWGDLLSPILLSCRWSCPAYGRIEKSCPSESALKKSQGMKL